MPPHVARFGRSGLSIDPVLAVGCVPGDEMMIMRLRMFAASLVAAAAIGQAGCSIVAPRPVAENPLLVPSADYETVWKTTVAVLDEYFDIATENRLSHTIVTQPKSGATLLEPWNGDSVGFAERLESTMQTIRRFARATITQAPAEAMSSRLRSTRSWKTWPGQSARPRVAPCSITTSRSTGAVRSSARCRFPTAGSA